MNFYACFILFPVTASLCQILFIIPPLLFNPADNHVLLKHDRFGVNILKNRFLHSTHPQKHTYSRIPGIHTLTFSPEQIICQKWVVQAPLHWSPQEKGVTSHTVLRLPAWTFVATSKVAKIVNYLKYFFWYQNCHFFHSSHDKKNIFYLCLFLFFSPSHPKFQQKFKNTYFF